LHGHPNNVTELRSRSLGIKDAVPVDSVSPAFGDKCRARTLTQSPSAFRWKRHAALERVNQELAGCKLERFNFGSRGKSREYQQTEERLHRDSRRCGYLRPCFISLIDHFVGAGEQNEAKQRNQLCARAASGQPTAVPPTNLMKSRRLIAATG